MSDDHGLEQLAAGSRQCPYKLAVVGGGPSGCSVIIRAFRIGFGGELCGFCSRKPAVDINGRNILADAQFPFQSAGVCLIDEDTVARFGGGKLQDYVINANTWANKFVTNVMDDKTEVLPKESVTGTPFQKLGNFDTAITLKSVGCKPAPLQMVGAFLRDAGTVVQEAINGKYPQSSKCMMETSVTSLQQVMLPVPAHLKNAHDKDSDVGSCMGWKLCVTQRGSSFPNGKLTKEIYAHKVVLATGGRQELPKLPNPAHTRKLMSSDFICTQKGMDELRARLLKAGVAQNKTLQGRVVVIGGSHSAFSAAWLCLHRLNESTAAEDGKPAGTGADTPTSKEDQLQFCQSGICLVYKSSIKVFYSTKADADKDGYIIEGAPGPANSQQGANGTPNRNGATAAAASQVSKSWIRGQIHPFGGLRGDAKELWRAVKDGRETRVKLLQVRSNVTTMSPGAPPPTVPYQKQLSIVERLFDDAVVIVWACGYTTNISMPVLDLNGVPVAMRIKSGQVEVDDNARVISAHPTLGVLPASIVVAAAVTPTIPQSPSLSSLASKDVEDLTVPQTLGVSADGSPVEDILGLDLSLPGSPTAKASQKLGLTPGTVPSSPSNQVPTSSSAEVPGIPHAPAAAEDSCPGTPKSTVPLAPAPFSMSPPLVMRSSSVIVKPAAPAAPVIEGLLGSGLGFGLQALLETGLPDGSSGRADGVAVYLKRGATLVLAQVLGNRVFGGPDIKSWEDRLKLIKRIALVANASSVKVADGAASTTGPGVSSSLDSGTSLLGSPTKRPSTTASVRNSFSGVGFTSPSSKAATPSQGGVLKRAIASKEATATSAAIAVTAVAAQVEAKFSPDKSKLANGSVLCDSPNRRGQSASFDFTFPQVAFPGEQPGSPVRPRSGSFNSAAIPSRPLTSGPCILSPRRYGEHPSPAAAAAIELIKSSPEARRCAELVDKVANLTADLEHLKLESAKEFLAIPKEGTSAKAADVAGVGRSQSPAAIPKARPRPESGGTSAPVVVVAKPTAIVSAPVSTTSAPRGASNSRGSAGSTANKSARTDRSASTKNSGTSNARVVLTPLDLDTRKKIISKSTPSSTNLTPRSVRANSTPITGAPTVAASASTTPRNKAPTKPVSSAASSSAAPNNQAVLRSNSLNHNQITIAKVVSVPSPRNSTVSRTSSGSSAGSSASSANNSTGAGTTTAVASKRSTATTNTPNGVLAKNVKLELPNIPIHKRSQNQREENIRANATIGKDQGIAMGKLVKALSVGAGNDNTKLVDPKVTTAGKSTGPIIVVNK